MLLDNIHAICIYTCGQFAWQYIILQNWVHYKKHHLSFQLQSFIITFLQVAICTSGTFLFLNVNSVFFFIKLVAWRKSATNVSATVINAGIAARHLCVSSWGCQWRGQSSSTSVYLQSCNRALRLPLWGIFSARAICASVAAAVYQQRIDRRTAQNLIRKVILKVLELVAQCYCYFYTTCKLIAVLCLSISYCTTYHFLHNLRYFALKVGTTQISCYRATLW